MGDGVPGRCDDVRFPPENSPKTLENAWIQAILELYHVVDRWRRHTDSLENEVQTRDRQLSSAEVRIRSLEDTVARLRAHLAQLEERSAQHEQATRKDGAP